MSLLRTCLTKANKLAPSAEPLPPLTVALPPPTTATTTTTTTTTTSALAVPSPTPARAQNGGSGSSSSSRRRSSSSSTTSATAAASVPAPPPRREFPPHPRKIFSSNARSNETEKKYFFPEFMMPGASAAVVASMAWRRGFLCRKHYLSTSDSFCVIPLYDGVKCLPWDDRSCSYRMVRHAEGSCGHWICRRRLRDRSRHSRRGEAAQPTSTAAAAPPRPAAHASTGAATAFSAAQTDTAADTTAATAAAATVAERGPFPDKSESGIPRPPISGNGRGRTGAAVIAPALIETAALSKSRDIAKM